MNDEETAVATRLHDALTPETNRKVGRLLAQAQRCFRLAETHTDIAVAERLEALGRSYLAEVHRLLSEEEQ
jgi:hypothetical protein